MLQYVACPSATFYMPMMAGDVFAAANGTARGEREVVKTSPSRLASLRRVEGAINPRLFAHQAEIFCECSKAKPSRIVALRRCSDGSEGS